jgi:chorismate mutase
MASSTWANAGGRDPKAGSCAPGGTVIGAKVHHASCHPIVIKEGDGMCPCRGIRGATTAAANTVEEIVSKTQELLQVLVAENDVQPEDIAAVIFTATTDIDAAFPARAARTMGWRDVPLVDMQAPKIPGDLAMCIRVLILWNTNRAQNEIKWPYLHGAKVLRPDKSGK